MNKENLSSLSSLSDEQLKEIIERGKEAQRELKERKSIKGNIFVDFIDRLSLSTGKIPKYPSLGMIEEDREDLEST